MTSPVSTSSPGPHPDPPADLAERPLAIEEMGHTWSRIHPADRDALYFGRAATHRFDDPDREFGVLYLAENEETAFIETFGHATDAPNLVALSEIGKRRLSRVEVKRPLRLVDLAGAGLSRLNADARLNSGDLAVSRRWSAALHAHPDAPDGVLYRTRHDPSRFAAAVYDRAARAVTVRDTLDLADPWHSASLSRILDRYGYGLV